MHIYPQRPHYSDVSGNSDEASSVVTTDDYSDSESGAGIDIQFDSDWDSISDFSVINFHRAYNRRYPAILRVNHQVYSEASSAMYNEGTFILEEDHIVCLSQDQKRLTYGGLVVWPDKNPWRHNPLLGAEIEKDGLVTCNSETMSGVMEPHVFRRFRQFHLQPSLAGRWVLINEETETINRACTLRFQDYLRESSFVEDLVKLISTSPEITQLSITLTLSDVRLESLSGIFSILRIIFERDETKVAEIYDLKETAHRRLTDIFLESRKNFAHLFDLTNVKNFIPQFVFDGYPKDRPYKPLAKHLALIQEIREKVEKNCRDPVDQPHGNFEDYCHIVVTSSSLNGAPSSLTTRVKHLSIRGWNLLNRVLGRHL